MGIKSFGNQANTFGNKFVRSFRGGDSTGRDATGAATAGGGSGLTATGGVIGDYVVGSEMFIGHISLLHQVLLIYKHWRFW